MLINKNIKQAMFGNVEIKRIMSEGGVLWEKKKIYNIDKFVDDNYQDLTKIDGSPEIYNTNIRRFRLRFGPNTPLGLIDRSNLNNEKVIMYFRSKNINTNVIKPYIKQFNRIFDNDKSFENDGGVFEWVNNNEFIITMPEGCVLDRFNELIFAWYNLDQHGISKEQLVKSLDIKLEVLEVI
jgi:hypothetical protein